MQNSGHRASMTLVLMLASCGNAADPSPDRVILGDCPRVVAGSSLVGCAGESAVFFIGGLDRYVVDVGAPRLEARIAIGEVVDLSVELRGCGSTNSTAAWVSTNPAVAALTPNGAYFADLSGVAAGSTVVYADLSFLNHQGFRVYPALYSGGSCQKIDVVDVAPD